MTPVSEPAPAPDSTTPTAAKPAANVVSNPRPRLAFFDISRSSTGTLLETRLLARSDGDWIEREEVAKVLREQELQSLFSPQAGQGRVAIGKLLRCDVLILLSQGAEKEAPWRLVVCETHRGLRLGVHSIRASSPEADAAALEQQAESSWRRYHSEIREVCVVPRFASNNLTFAFDHLGAVYPKFIEQQLIREAGVALVELDEARAITRELELAASADTVQARYPLFILGEFRLADPIARPASPAASPGEDDAEQVAASRPVTIRLSFQRQGKPIAEETADLRADQVVEFLQTTTHQVLARESGRPATKSSRFDHLVEATELYKRARALQNAGNVEGAVELIEAALLLADCSTYRRLAIELWPQRVLPPLAEIETSVPERRRVVQQYLRGLEHAEWLVRNREKVETALPFGRYSPYMALPRQPSAEIVEFLKEARETERNLLRSIACGLTRNGLDGGSFAGALFDTLPPEERVDELYRLLIRCLDSPILASQTVSFTHRAIRGSRPEKWLKSAAGVAFLDRLAEQPHPELQRAVAAMRKAELTEMSRIAMEYQFYGRPKFPMTNNASLPEPPKRPAPKWEVSPRTIAMTKLNFEYRHEVPLRHRGDFLGSIAAGDAADVYWQRNALFLMTRPNVLSLVWQAAPKSTARVESVCFDGRWIWAGLLSSGHGSEPSQVLVLDPETERFRPLGVDDGVPLATKSSVTGMHEILLLAPVAPGKVVACGYFGRTWVGTIEYVPDSPPKVTVLHEAREQTSRDPLKMAFRPYFLQGFSAPGAGAMRWALVGRHSGTNPLWIDLEQRTVEIRGSPVLPLHVRDNVLFGLRERPDRSLTWLRAEAPDFQPKEELADFPKGQVHFVGSEMHVIGEQWWHSPGPSGPLRIVMTKLPWKPNFGAVRLVASRHHGMVLHTMFHRSDDPIGYSTFAVDWRDAERTASAR